jgi:hypothetical protein
LPAIYENKTELLAGEDVTFEFKLDGNGEEKVFSSTFVSSLEP